MKGQVIRVVIHPKYEHIRGYIDLVANSFDSLGILLESRRNILRQDTVQGIKIVIKSFKRIYLPNRIRYGLFYPSKAQRAFDYANTLLEKGFNTPHPVAYIEVRRSGLLIESYFISEYLDYQPLEQVVDYSSNITSAWVRDFAAYTFRLHQSNLYHVDYTVGNVLMKKLDSGFDFALVDNNRMEFGPVSFRKGMMNFVRLRLSVADHAGIAKEYAHLWHIDEMIGVAQFFSYKTKGMQRSKVKGFIKRLFKRVRFSATMLTLISL